MRTFQKDLVHAVRILLKSPRFTIAVVLTLAIGIASNIIIFGIAQNVFIRPMTYPDAKNLVYVSQAYPGFPEGGGQFSYKTFRDILLEDNSFDAFAAYQINGPLAVTDHGEPVRVAVTYCTPSYFKLLGVRTVLGRVIEENEDRVGSADPVIVLSYSFWQRQYAGDPHILGRTIHLNEHPFTVIGVTDRNFRDSLYEQEYGEQSNA